MGAKGVVGEPDRAVAVESEEAEPAYRGDLNGAYREWREAGAPVEPKHPAFRKFCYEADLFLDRMISKAIRDYPDLHDSRARLREANQRSFQRALTRYDQNRSTASFTTYLKKAGLNNISQEFRHLFRTTHQAEMVRAFGGNRHNAKRWINSEREVSRNTDDGVVESRTLHNVPPRDRPLMLWLLDQDPCVRVTWRQVQAAFPQYSEDQAGRALRRVKKFIELKGFYKPRKLEKV